MELEAAYLYLISILENLRNIPDVTYKSRNFEEYLEIEKELLSRIHELSQAPPPEDPEIPVITKFAHRNYPNPFNPETTIAFDIPSATNVSIDIFNIRGQKVKTLINDYVENGSYKVVWDGRDNNAASVSSGIYFYRIITDEDKVVQKMLLMK